MFGVCRVGLTGTPGVGKTTVAGLLAKLGHSVHSVRDLALENGCLEAIDRSDDSAPIDVDLLRSKLAWEGCEIGDDSECQFTFIDGHMSHWLDVDILVVLRLSPEHLSNRLTERGYSAAKILENLEWEILGAVRSEIEQTEFAGPILEIDVSDMSANQVAERISNWLSSPSTSLLNLDWLEEWGPKYLL